MHIEGRESPSCRDQALAECFTGAEPGRSIIYGRIARLLSPQDCESQGLVALELLYQHV